MIYLLTFLITIFGFLVIEHSIIVPKINGLRVLMYHKIEATLPPDRFTVTTHQLEDQFKILQEKQYNCISMQDLIDYQLFQKPLAKNPFLLTFDDGYQNNFSHLYPLLLKYQFKAVVFLVADFINRSELNESGEHVYLSLEEIKQMDPAVVEFALHSFNHKSYNDLSIEEIDTDITASKQTLDALGIKYLPCHSFTYGAFPKKDAAKREQLYKILSKHNVEMAFRIGNRVNKLPLENPYLVKRIDVRGTDSLFQFKTKLRTGRSKFFG